MTVLMVVPTLGERPAMLRKSLESIATQGVDVDIVAVAPPGKGVEELVTEFGGRFVPDPGQGGQSGAINAGIAAAAEGTEYFAWLGDDDLLAPGSLAATTAALAARSDATLAYGWCDYIDLEGRVVFRSNAGRIADWILRFGPNLIPQPGSLARFSHVRELGGVSVEATQTMDLDLWLRLRKRGPFVALNQTLASFRWHADSLTVRDEKFSMNQSDETRMRHMTPLGARLYRTVFRWPGWWALWLAKRRVRFNTARAARAGR
ncbi:GT2 family glycosyltransferase [Marmoricola sp. URHA0025 HA25]